MADDQQQFVLATKEQREALEAELKNTISQFSELRDGLQGVIKETKKYESTRKKVERETPTAESYKKLKSNIDGFASQLIDTSSKLSKVQKALSNSVFGIDRWAKNITSTFVDQFKRSNKIDRIAKRGESYGNDDFDDMVSHYRDVHGKLDSINDSIREKTLTSQSSIAEIFIGAEGSIAGANRQAKLLEEELIDLQKESDGFNTSSDFKSMAGNIGNAVKKINKLKKELVGVDGSLSDMAKVAKQLEEQYSDAAGQKDKLEIIEAQREEFQTTLNITRQQKEEIEEQLELQKKKEQMYRDAVELTRETYEIETAAAQKKLEEIEATKTLAAVDTLKGAVSNKYLTVISNTIGKVKKMGSALWQAAKSHPYALAAAIALTVVFGAIIASVKIVTKLFQMGADRLEEIEQSTLSIRKQFGLSAESAGQMTEYLDRTREHYLALGLSSSQVAENIGAMRERMGFARDVTDEEVNLINEMNARLGISADVGAGVLQVFSLMGDHSRGTNMDMTAMVIKLSEAGKVAPAQVMSDIASWANEAFLYVGGTGEKLAGAAIHARQLGLDLQKTSAIAEQLLDWESSISAEMEASVMLGRSLNLNRARTLAYNKDTVGMMQELTTQLGGIDFEMVDPLTLKKIEQAMGLTTVQMANMIALQTKFSKITAADQEKYSKLTKEQQQLILENSELEGDRLSEYIAMQTSMGALKSAWAGVLGTFGKIAQPIVKRVMGVLTGILNKFRGAMTEDAMWAKVTSSLDKIGDKVINIATALFDEGNIRRIEGIFNKIISAATWIVNVIGSVAEFMGVGAGNLLGAGGNDSPIARSSAGGITSGVGMRKDPGTGHAKMHYGVDMKAPVGTPVVAQVPGRVLEHKYDSDDRSAQTGFGRYMNVAMEDSVMRLAHLSAFGPSPGTPISPGDIIAYTGNSGRSFGPHLHLEQRENKDQYGADGYSDPTSTGSHQYIMLADGINRDGEWAKYPKGEALAVLSAEQKVPSVQRVETMPQLAIDAINKLTTAVDILNQRGVQATIDGRQLTRHVTQTSRA